MIKLRSVLGDQRGWVALLLVGSLVGTGSVFAQRDDYLVAPGRDATYDLKPDTKPSDITRASASLKRLIRERRGAVRDCLDADTTFTNERKADFDKWYLGYEFPTLTLYTPEALKELYEGRKRLFREELERSTNKETHDHLVDLAFNFFKKVAAEDYHPAVRYNAMLIIGELNSRELDRNGTNSIAPLPLRAALDFMIKEYKNPDQIDAVRLAALLGIQRHAQLDAQSETAVPTELIPQTELKEIRALALDLVRTREAPEGRTQDGHDWMRRRGVEILSWLASATLDQEIVDVVVERLADSDENRGVRCEAALAINNMNYLPAPGKPRLGNTPVKLNPRKVAADLVQFVVDATTTDVDHVTKYLTSLTEAEEIYGSGTGGGMKGYGGSGGGMKGYGGSGGGMKGYGGSGGGMKGGSTRGMGGPPPGMKSGSAPRSSSSSSSSGSGMSGAMGGAGGYGQTKVEDPFAFRIEPVYRKLRYEIGCAMKGLRGTDDWRKGDGSGGLYKLFANPADPKVAADKEFLGRAADALKTLANKLKVKTEDLETANFVIAKLPLAPMNELVGEVAVRAKPVKPKPEVEAKDPATEPDPADELERTVEPEASAPKAGEKKPAPAKPAPAKPAPAKPVSADPAEEPAE